MQRNDSWVNERLDTLKWHGAVSVVAVGGAGSRRGLHQSKFAFSIVYNFNEPMMRDVRILRKTLANGCVRLGTALMTKPLEPSSRHMANRMIYMIRDNDSLAAMFLRLLVRWGDDAEARSRASTNVRLFAIEYDNRL